MIKVILLIRSDVKKTVKNLVKVEVCFEHVFEVKLYVKVATAETSI